MVARTSGGPRTGIWLAFGCLLLLGLMPIIANGRPAGASALTFAFWLTVWQFLSCLPLQVREWRGGERGVLAGTGTVAGARAPVALEEAVPAVSRRVVVIAVGAGVLFALSTWCYVVAFETVGTVNAAIALQVYPLFAAGLEALLLGRGRSLVELGFIAVIVAALYYLATQGTWRMAGLSAWFVVALAVPALWSVAHVTLREVLVSTPITPNQVTTSRLLVSVLCLLPLTLVVDGPAALARSATDLPWQAFAVAMGLAYYSELIIWFHAVCHIDVSVASTITAAAPAVTLLLAIPLLGERVHRYQVVALVLVVAGLVGLLRAGSRRHPGPAPVLPAEG